MAAQIITTNRGENCSICQEAFNPGEKQVTHVGGEKHGFHETCLKNWLAVRYICPLDRQPIDPSALITRTDRIMARLRPALANAAYAICFGIAAEAIGAAVAAKGLIAGVGGAIAGAGTGIAAGIAGIAGIALGARLAAEVGTGIAIGIGIDWIFDGIGVDEISRENIGFGISMGGMVTLGASIANVTLNPLMAIAITSLVGGVAAGIFSLIRR